MPAPNGNQFGVKLKDGDVRKEAFRQYCAHLAAGYPKEAFFFDHPEHSVCWKTMERYIKENPDEFPSILIERAKANRYKHWLDKGKALMEGQFKNGSPVVWQTCMRNIFREIGWDQELSGKEADNSHLDRMIAFFEKIRITQEGMKIEQENASSMHSAAI